MPQHGAYSGWIKYAGNTAETYHGELEKHEDVDVPEDNNVPENAYNKLAGFWGLSRKLQDDKTTTQHLVTLTMLIDTTIK